METRRRRRFVHAQIVWMLGAVVLLTALESLTLDLFFILSLIGFLVVVELTAPVAVSPRWRRRIPWLIVAGLLAFVYIVVRRIIEILPPGVLP